MSDAIELGHGLSISFTKNTETGAPDVWLNFHSRRKASLSIAALADTKRGIIGGALLDWAGDRLNEPAA